MCKGLHTWAGCVHMDAFLHLDSLTEAVLFLVSTCIPPIVHLPGFPLLRSFLKHALLWTFLKDDCHFYWPPSFSSCHFPHHSAIASTTAHVPGNWEKPLAGRACDWQVLHPLKLLLLLRKLEQGWTASLLGLQAMCLGWKYRAHPLQHPPTLLWTLCTIIPAPKAAERRE